MYPGHKARDDYNDRPPVPCATCGSTRRWLRRTYASSAVIVDAPIVPSMRAVKVPASRSFFCRARRNSGVQAWRVLGHLLVGELVAHLDRLQHELGGALGIALHALAPVEHGREVVDAVRAAEVGGLTIEVGGHAVVLLHALALLVEIAEAHHAGDAAESAARLYHWAALAKSTCTPMPWLCITPRSTIAGVWPASLARGEQAHALEHVLVDAPALHQ